MSHHDALLLLARICLVLMFPFSAIDKIVHWKDALAQANSSFTGSTTSSFLPGGPLLVAAMVIEFVTPICIVLLWHERPAALLLAAFCVVTALLYHPFWRQGDFWVQGNSVDRQHFWDFTKNFGLTGGLLLVAAGI